MGSPLSTTLRRSRRRIRRYIKTGFPPRLKFVGLAVATVALVVSFSLLISARQPIADAGKALGYVKTEPAGNLPQATVAFLGDSYTAGTGTDSSTKSFAAITANILGLKNLGQFAVGGTGYTTEASTSYASRVPALVATNPNVVIVSGSRNDSGAGTERIRLLSGEVLGQLRQGLPDATIIVVGPFWVDNSVPSDIQDLNTGIREAAPAAGAIFVDALNPSWLPGTGNLISSDGVHPNELGHKELAVRMAATVQTLCLEGQIAGTQCQVSLQSIK